MNIRASSARHPGSAAHGADAPEQTQAQARASDRDDHHHTEPDAQALTEEERAALALHRRHLSERSYLPEPADFLHVR